MPADSWKIACDTFEPQILDFSFYRIAKKDDPKGPLTHQNAVQRPLTPTRDTQRRPRSERSRRSPTTPPHPPPSKKRTPLSSLFAQIGKSSTDGPDRSPDVQNGVL